MPVRTPYVIPALTHALGDVTVAMALRIVRLGTPRTHDEGLRVGTVRRPPRGVKKEDRARRDFYDVWLPELAPSNPLVTWALSTPWTDKRWALYAKRYRREMAEPGPRHMLELLARLSYKTDLAVGCYCEREDRCHRSLLRDLLAEHGADFR
jgi:uncharacterized protein YeaO (DUF488 family)